MGSQPAKIRSRSGVKRDGTRFDGDYYNDAQWCRFQRGLPRKMGGFQVVSRDLPQPVYGMSSFSRQGKQYVHLGSHSQLQQRVLTASGAISAFADRTPGPFTDTVNNIWSMDVFFDVNLGNCLVAQVAPNMDISNDTEDAHNIFVGPVTANTPLIVSGQDPVDGGIITVGNYSVGYGSDGYVQWSDANNIATPTLDAQNVTAQKIVTAKRVRGGGVPAALMWSLDSLLQMTFNDPASELWDFDTLSEDSTIISSRAVVEYGGVYYWPGVDRFLMYNGVLRELPNDMNQNWFFDNLNFAQRQKIYAIKVQRFGEIWWCYPRGSATECTHAVIYNVREGTWYDTQLPDQGRTDGLSSQVFFRPLMMGAEHTVDGYDLWQHEYGTDRVRIGPALAIQSYFETKELNFITLDDKASNAAVCVDIIEPDFVQSGNLTVSVRGRANARAPIIDEVANSQTIVPNGAGVSADDQVARFETEFRLLSFKFESNVAGGNFQAGETIAQVRPGDERITQ